MATAASDTLTAAPPAPDASNVRERPAPPRGTGALQLRLVISIPAILILVALIYGVVSYISFSLFWDELESSGAGEIARALLRIHMSTLIMLACASAVVGLVLSFTILRPIRALLDATRQVAHGRLDRHATEIPSARELDDLSSSFNQMIDTINQSISERSRQLMEGIPIGVMTTDLEGRIGAVSPLAGQIIGLPSEKIMGLRVGELLGSVPRPVHVLIEYLQGQVHDPTTRETAEVTLADARGDQKLTVNSTLLRDNAGEPFGFMFSFRETARMRDLSDQLSQSDQLAALGTFTLGLAHELRNPLGAIKGFSQLLMLERDLPARTADFLARMVGEVDRVDLLVRQLSDLSEQPLACRVATGFESILRRAAEAARQAAPPERVKMMMMKCEMSPLPQFLLEHDRLAQAFTKIIQNAYELAAPGATITLRAGQNGPAWQVEVRNTGSTLPDENRQRVFEPFFTTREKATGLGLTIARQIIAQNGGRVEAGQENGEVVFRALFENLSLAKPEAPAHAREGGTP